MTATATDATANGHTRNGEALPLYPSHLAELRASGLTDDTIRAAGIRSEADPRRLASILNRKSTGKLGASLLFPYWDASGAVVQHRVKPERPPTLSRGANSTQQ